MPIEIKELHIKVNIEGKSEDSLEDRRGISRREMNRIIAICVEQVLEVLSKKKER